MAEAKKELDKELATVEQTVAEQTQNPVGKFYAEKGQESLENLQKGGKEVIVSLTNTTKVEFIKDFGFIKKGHIQEVSDVALEIYSREDVVKKL